jgi:hypothetical protein
MALIKYNASGDTIWTRTYGGSAREGGYSVQQTTDGGYIIGGETRSFGPGAPDSSNIYIIKTDSIGDTLWTKIFGGRGYDCCLSIQQTQDGGYIATGFTSSYGAGSWDIFILKMNASGDTLWTRIFGGVNTDCGYSIQQTTDGGYIVAGNTISFGTGSWEAYIVKMNASGDTLWTKTYGGVNFECGYSIQQTTDGGYIVAGSTNSYGSGTPNYNNVYLIKMDASGNATVEENKIRVQSVNSRIQAIPNPFTSFARIPGYEKDDFSLSDITGRLIGKYRGERIGENLPAGVYFIIPQNKNLKPIRIVKIR